MAEPVPMVIAAAREFLGDRITTNATLREHHSHGQNISKLVFTILSAVAEAERDRSGQGLASSAIAAAVPDRRIVAGAGEGAAGG